MSTIDAIAGSLGPQPQQNSGGSDAASGGTGGSGADDGADRGVAPADGARSGADAGAGSGGGAGQGSSADAGAAPERAPLPYAAPPAVDADSLAMQPLPRTDPDDGDRLGRAFAPDLDEAQARRYAEAAQDRIATEALIAAIQPPPENAPSLPEDVATLRQAADDQDPPA